MNVYPLVKLTLPAWKIHTFMWKIGEENTSSKRFKNFSLPAMLLYQRVYIYLSFFLSPLTGIPHLCAHFRSQASWIGSFGGFPICPFCWSQSCCGELPAEPPEILGICLSQNLWKGSEMNFQMSNPISLPNEKNKLPSGKLRIALAEKKNDLLKMLLWWQKKAGFCPVFSHGGNTWSGTTWKWG